MTEDANFYRLSKALNELRINVENMQQLSVADIAQLGPKSKDANVVGRMTPIRTILDDNPDIEPMNKLILIAKAAVDKYKVHNKAQRIWRESTGKDPNKQILELWPWMKLVFNAGIDKRIIKAGHKTWN